MKIRILRLTLPLAAFLSWQIPLQAQWIQTNGPYAGIIYCFAVSGTNLFAGTDDGVFLSTNDGTSWTKINNGLTNTNVRAFAVSGTNLFAGTYGGVFFSTNNGTSWTEVSTGLTSLWVTSFAISGTNLFAGTYGGVFLSTDNGTSWTEVNAGLTNTWVNALAVNGTNLFAGTWGGGVFLSSNGDISWAEVNAGLTNTYVTALAVNGTNLLAGTWGGGIFLSINNSASWTSVNNGLIDDSIVAYWPFEGNAVDASGNGLDGIVNGAQLTKDRFGHAESAYMFDGVNDYIGINGNIGNPQSGTITAWACALSHEPVGYNQLNLIFGQWDNFQLGLADTTIGGGIEGDGRWTFRLNDGLGPNVGSGYNLKSIVGGPKVMLNEWNFVAATWNGQEMILYLNGTEISRLEAGAPIEAWGNLVIGAHPAIQNFWHGMLDDICIYKRDLSGEEIRDVMGVPGIQTIVPNGCDVMCFAVNGSKFFAGTWGGGVFLTTNNGTRWAAVNSDLTNTDIHALAVGGMNLFVGTGDGGVWRRPLSEMLTSVEEPLADRRLPENYSLEQNYPNPFNPSTSIEFHLSSLSFMTLKVFNSAGKEIASLVDKQLPAGNHRTVWNASGVPSGVYFYRIQAGAYSETKKLVIIR